MTELTEDTSVADEPDEVGNLTVNPDEGPKDGNWVDTDEVITSLTEEEAEAGRLMGESIDIDDDDSTGVE